jgi:protein SCO1
MKNHGPFRLVLRVALIALAALPRAACGQADEAPPPGFEGATVVEKSNAKVPLDVQFKDEDGRDVRLGDYFGAKRPVLLALVYFRCPMLCGLTLNGMVKSLRAMSLQPGKDFEMVTIGFDPREGPALAAAKKVNYIEALGVPEAAAGWHFLTSDRPAAAKAVGDAIGFGYKLDPKGENYLHQAAIYVCTPDGRVARTMRGVEFDPGVLRDSLINASAGKISSGLWGVALSCGLLHYDPASGKYTWAALAIMRVTGFITVAAVALLVGSMVYREKRRRPQE